MHCPKCHAPMHGYQRNGVQIEQCSGCRGIFLDYGELEALTRLESQWSPGPPAAGPYPAAPAWGAPHHEHHGHHEHYGHRDHHGHYGHRESFMHMLFSS